MQKASDKKPVIKIIAHDAIPVGDLVDVQEIPRETNMLRILYRTKSTG